MDYNSLVRQIKSYANRDDLSVSDIDSFIQMGQQRIWREAKDLGFELTFCTANFVAGTAMVAKPFNWNKTISFLVGAESNFSESSKPLYQRTYEFCRIYWPNSAIKDVPLFYSDHPATNGGFSNAYSFFHIAPTPDKNYRFELTYLSRVDPVTTGKTTNLLTDRFPDLLFYACFLEALQYLKDDERIQMYEANYARALQSVNNQSQERKTDRTSNTEIN